MESLPKDAPYWWEIASTPDLPKPVELPDAIDVVIAGAGHTGLSAARTLARKGQGVLVLDQGIPGYAASSRNGGMIGGGHRVSLDATIGRYGRSVGARIIREAYIDSMEFALNLMTEEEIACDYEETGRLRPSLTKFSGFCARFANFGLIHFRNLLYLGNL